MNYSPQRYSPQKDRIYNSDNTVNIIQVEKIIEQNIFQQRIIRFYFFVIISLTVIIIFALIFIN